MFCSTCGKENINDAIYCAYCGKPLVTILTVEHKKEEIAWEYCQIQADWKDVSRESCFGALQLSSDKVYDCYLWADALGRNGPYSAGETEHYRIQGRKFVWDEPSNPPLGTNKEDKQMTREILNNLIIALQKDGWEILNDRGTAVWQIKFRRKEDISNKTHEGFPPIVSLKSEKKSDVNQNRSIGSYKLLWIILIVIFICMILIGFASRIN
jgi:hypothetical protein